MHTRLNFIFSLPWPV